MTTKSRITDIDPRETREWMESLQAVLARDGADRVRFLLERLGAEARRARISLPSQPHALNTPYINTIPPSEEAPLPGDFELEHHIRSLIRWNALAMVVRANRISTELGGHIASFASSATLYEVGFNHFFRAPTKDHGGDLVFIQGHSAPGIYARAYLEGRITEQQLENFRREVDGNGLSSYPHPWLMWDFWQFPTVSMGLGPLQAIFQAHFMKYLKNRGLLPDVGDRKVWAFMGDGEMDEPESLGEISLAARERLDNLIFVINCNLQRLDGPVRGNGKIIQELEAEFRGAGWNVIKVIWGRHWDPLIARDAARNTARNTESVLLRAFEETLDGEYQDYRAARDGAYVREHFFGKYPELTELVADMSDEEIWRLNRGGHDPYKVYAAYKAAVEHRGQPTVILAKTVKGYGMGAAGEGMNITHQQKKMGTGALEAFLDRFEGIPISDDQVPEVPFHRPPDDSPEIRYLEERRNSLGGSLPVRRVRARPLAIPALQAFSAQLEGTGKREISTTMALVRIMATLIRDKEIGKLIVPIVADEARTFGMEGLFRQIGIYSARGQKYRPQDADQLMFYREARDGQILEEGISEASALSSFIAAGTAYSNHGINMIPFYIFYSMFGFQRTGDLAWAAGDIQARGFLIGGTAGRTTLAGEGLQHQDGHSHLLASTIPNCIPYDPTFGYELAVIVREGLRRMFEAQESVFYYITVMNENYPHPAMPPEVEDGIIRGMYPVRETIEDQAKPGVQLLGSGAILREVLAGAELLESDFGIPSDVWSVTSFTELRRDGLSVERWNRLHPEREPKRSYVETRLAKRSGPVVAATDYMQLFADQIRPFIHAPYTVLGTDGFGRSDTRENLRRFFEVNRYHVVVAALESLADSGEIAASRVFDAISRYGIDPEWPDPVSV
uniref:Pyruvate dehydrogenase E1 component n=1 Tax=Candidatus Kentrum sp. LFY TaxID=2126342 RepID=A0A450UCZ6_9GAMM|nr:MAG: pyruvate dehydrogenase E1 component [Candidatus Kentron sp. LFY]